MGSSQSKEDDVDAIYVPQFFVDEAKHLGAEGPTTPSIKNPKNAGRPELKGVSVHWLRHGLLEEAKEAGLNDRSKVYEIENLQGPPGVIRMKGVGVECPMYHRKGAAYVHCLEGEDNVGDATHMLSYTWGYAIGDIVDTLEAFCAAENFDPKRSYFWICCLCNNQHKIVDDREKGVDVPPDEFEQIFRGRVVDIGRVVAMMEPWEKPRYLTRVWCIFETYTAIQELIQEEEVDDELSVVMPPRDRKKMWEEVVINTEDEKGDMFSDLYHALAGTKVENAESSVAADKEKILNLLERAEGGFVATNVRVNNFLRKWVRDVLMEQFQRHLLLGLGEMSAKEYWDMCSKVGLLFDANGEYEYAEKTLFVGFKNIRRLEGHEDPLIKASHRTAMAKIRSSTHQFKEALEMYQEALSIYESSGGDDHALEVAKVHMNIGSLLVETEENQEGYRELQKALDIHGSLGKEDPDTADIYCSMGRALQKMGQYTSATEKYLKGLSIQEERLGNVHPYVVSTRNGIGSLLLDQGWYDEALQQHEQALEIVDKVLGEHPIKGETYDNIGNVLVAMGQYEDALKAHRKAFDLRKVILSGTHPSIAVSYNHIGMDWYHLSEVAQAKEVYREAVGHRRKAFGRKPDKEMVEPYDAALAELRDSLA